MPPVGLHGFPAELRLEVAEHVSLVLNDLAHLSSCNGAWRQLCLPLLFRGVKFSCYIANQTIGRFLVHNAACYGHLIREIIVDTFHVYGASEEFGHAIWTVGRAQLLATLISFTPNLSSVCINYGLHGFSTAVADAFKELSVALGKATSIRRAILRDTQSEGSIYYDFVLKRGHNLDTLIISGVDPEMNEGTFAFGSNWPSGSIRCLSLGSITVGTLLKTGSFPALTHLHLDVYDDAPDIMDTVCAVQNTLLYLSIEGGNLPSDDPLRVRRSMEPTLPQIQFLRLGRFKVPEESISAFRDIACHKVAIIIDRDQELDSIRSLLRRGDFPTLRHLWVGNWKGDVMSFDEPFKEVCAGRDIVIGASSEMLRLPNCLGGDDSIF